MVNQLGGDDVYDPFGSDIAEDIVNLEDDLVRPVDNDSDHFNDDDYRGGEIGTTNCMTDFHLEPIEFGVRTGLARGDAHLFNKY